MKKENISDAVIRRLPRYYRQLTDLCGRGIVRISSHSLGQEMNITASQIRQDFSCFGEWPAPAPAGSVRPCGEDPR